MISPKRKKSSEKPARSDIKIDSNLDSDTSDGDGEFQSETTKREKRKLTKRKSVTKKKTADFDVV